MSGVAEGIDDCRYLGVLSAFSQAQKEHKRHSVHLATLRAHGKVFTFAKGSLLIIYLVKIVKKIAKDREDKLGPQWASWVGKAVKKLVRLVSPFVF